jgi:hypothetical protein
MFHTSALGTHYSVSVLVGATFFFALLARRLDSVYKIGKG